MSQSRPTARFEFLDGMRFLCALWVAIGHLGLPRFSDVIPSPIGVNVDLLLRPIGYVFNGSAAVMAFFIISGFCIHLAYIRGKAFEVVPFYIARLPRVALPALAAILIGYLLPDGLDQLKSVLWSLYSEMLYYLAYPLLRVFYKKYSIRRCLVVTYLVSILAMITVIESPEGSLSGMSIPASTIYGLPVWILGCGIAKLVVSGPAPFWASELSTAWVLRAFVLLACPVLLLLNFHSPLHYLQTMIFFSIPCGVWIYVEFCQKSGQRGYEYLAGLGQATFSLYLVHKLALAFGNWIGPDALFARQMMIYVLVIIFSWIFFLSIEKPSHQVCRKIASRMQQRKLVVEPTQVLTELPREPRR